MKFTREAYLKYVEQVEEEYATLSNCESSLAKDILNKPVPSFDGSICVWGLDYVAYFDCVLSGCGQDNTVWATYIGLQSDDSNDYRTWEVNCCTMEMFKALIYAICKCKNFTQAVEVLKGSDWCEG